MGTPDAGVVSAPASAPSSAPAVAQASAFARFSDDAFEKKYKPSLTDASRYIDHFVKVPTGDFYHGVRPCLENGGPCRRLSVDERDRLAGIIARFHQRPETSRAKAPSTQASGTSEEEERKGRKAFDNLCVGAFKGPDSGPWGKIGAWIAGIGGIGGIIKLVQKVLKWRKALKVNDRLDDAAKATKTFAEKLDSFKEGLKKSLESVRGFFKESLPDIGKTLKYIVKLEWLKGDGTVQPVTDEKTHPILRNANREAHALFGRPDRLVVFRELEDLVQNPETREQGVLFMALDTRTKFYVVELMIDRFLELSKRKQKKLRKMDPKPYNGKVPVSHIRETALNYLNPDQLDELREAGRAWTRDLAGQMTKNMDRKVIARQLGDLPLFEKEIGALPYLARMAEDEWLWIGDIKKMARFVDVEEPHIPGTLPPRFLEAFAKEVDLEEVRRGAEVYARLLADDPKFERETFWTIQEKIRGVLAGDAGKASSRKKPEGAKGGKGGSGTPGGNTGNGGAPSANGRNGKAHTAAGVGGMPSMEAAAPQYEEAWRMSGVQMTGMREEEPAIAQQEEAWATSGALMAQQAAAASALAVSGRAGMRVA